MEFLTFTKDIVEQASSMALVDYHQSRHGILTYKDASQIVTKTDVAVEKLIVDAIRKRFPDHCIVGEESGRTNGTAKYCWYIDPIDGTTNFAYRIPLWGISVALFCDEKPLLGVIAFPAMGELMWAEKGKGAFCNGEPLKVNGSTTIGQGLVLTCPNPRKFPDHVQAYLRSLETVPQVKIRSMGACTANLHLMAIGSAMTYMDRQLSIYDYAAGALIVEEAGGCVTDFEGKPWWQTADSGGSFVLATNGALHEEVLKAVRKQ